MKLHKMFFMFPVIFLLVSTASVPAAGDFDWTSDFNIRAEADPSGFRARLAARFRIGDAQINAVVSHVERPADAYIVLRLGEMAAKPADYVMEKYRSGKGKGWGALAQSLGIKPGSKEFHDLKRGNDLYEDNEGGKGKGKGQGKGRQK
ncbi:MAG: hypothetical protein FIA94_12440 [Nitrospirae bacterium]|nr:hypothetical protein [Nitrospirota bacterium]